jgi:hypothetical protein
MDADSNPPDIDLEWLIEEVDRQADSDDPLDRLTAAVLRHHDLTSLADDVLDHFVQAARQAGCSWTQIGEVLGVTKQAAQQRHADRRSVKDWFRRRGGSGRLFSRFTDRARGAVEQAQVAARELRHNYIGTEHVLLGLLSDPDSVAAKALAGWAISQDDVVAEIEQRIGRGDQSVAGHIPFTPRAKKSLELSLRQAITLGHNYIGTEHILLGVIEMEEGVAGQILADRDVTLDMARQKVVELLFGYQR